VFDFIGSGLLTFQRHLLLLALYLLSREDIFDFLPGDIYRRGLQECSLDAPSRAEQPSSSLPGRQAEQTWLFSPSFPRATKS